MRNPAAIAPRRACLSERAARVRWTIDWSVHQYQTDVNGSPKNTPVHGYTGCVAGWNRCAFAGVHTDRAPDAAATRLQQGEGTD